MAREQRDAMAPRDRILAAALALFYARGIRAVGVDEIAEAASTNKMTLYRHFGSKDGLVVAYLRARAAEAERVWDEVARDHSSEPRTQLEVWVIRLSGNLAEEGHRGCAIANAAIELPEPDHPARIVIEEYKTRQREQLSRLCGAAAFADPERLADEIFLLMEGARVSMQSVGCCGPAGRVQERIGTLLKSAPRENV
jgi:AcrR family transcriptional regulator